MDIVSKSNKFAWITILVLSALFLLWTVPLLTLSGGTMIVEQGLNYAASNLVVSEVEPAALGYFNIAVLKPLWEELWIGILGIYLAIQIRRGKSFAWWLGLFWGIMLITDAIIQGAYELVVLNWQHACVQTYLFLFIGVVATASLLITRKRFFKNQPSVRV